MVFAVYIASELKGLYISLARAAAREHETWILARDKHGANLARSLAPELADRVLVFSDFMDKVRVDDPVRQARELEQRYNVKMSFFSAYDRGIGQGYLTNAEKHPHVHRSYWNWEKKLEGMVRTFLAWEAVYKHCRPDLVACHDRPAAMDLIVRGSGGRYITLVTARIGSRYMWVDDSYQEKRGLDDRIRAYIEAAAGRDGAGDVEYKPYSQYLHTRNVLRYSYGQAVAHSLHHLLTETYQVVRGIRKEATYIFGGWIPYEFRKVACYRWACRHGIMPGDIAGRKYVYFPLQQEPELSLLNLSPEFNNSMEIIVWLSKNLPADVTLVVKENPWGFGVRPLSYYNRLRKIGNVEVAHPDSVSMDWIQGSAVCAAITGTVGFETVYAGKPLVCYGAHHWVRALPTVALATSYWDTKKALELFLEGGRDLDYNLSREALDHVLHELSFEAPGIERLYKDTGLHEKEAGWLWDSIRSEYLDAPKSVVQQKDTAQ